MSAPVSFESHGEEAGDSSEAGPQFLLISFGFVPNTGESGLDRPEVSATVLALLTWDCVVVRLNGLGLFGVRGCVGVIERPAGVCLSGVTGGCVLVSDGGLVESFDDWLSELDEGRFTNLYFNKEDSLLLV